MIGPVADKKSILLIITNCYAATNVIHSGLIRNLAQEYEIYIVSDLIHENELAVINRYFDIYVQKIEISIPTESNLVKVLRWFEKAFFFHYFKIETQNIKEKGKAAWYGLAVNAAFGLTGFFNLNAILLKFLRKEIISCTGNCISLRQLHSYNFCGVISSSPLDIRENTIVNFMRNTASLAMIISWDNLSSKGIINADHDYVLAWNGLMSNEYQRFYSLFNPANPQVCITGIPRFDIYFKQLPEEYSITEFRKRYRIGASDKVILFTTSAIGHFPNQTDIVKHLLEYTAQKENVKIIVRCHAGDNFELYKKFIEEEKLIIWRPYDVSNLVSISTWMPDLNILNSLAEMLKHCDVCINVASTIRLEAAVCNKPNINIAYDGELNQDFYHSVKRFYGYSHQIPLNRLEIDNMVYSKKELFDNLDNVLYNSCSEKNDTSERIQEFTFHTGPFAVATTMKYIRQWLA